MTRPVTPYRSLGEHLDKLEARGMELNRDFAAQYSMGSATTGWAATGVDSAWRTRVHDLVETSFTPIHDRHVVEMGFPDTWRNDPFWSGGPHD